MARFSLSCDDLEVTQRSSQTSCFYSRSQLRTPVTFEVFQSPLHLHSILVMTSRSSPDRLTVYTETIKILSNIARWSVRILRSSHDIIGHSCNVCAGTAGGGNVLSFARPSPPSVTTIREICCLFRIFSSWGKTPQSYNRTVAPDLWSDLKSLELYNGRICFFFSHQKEQKALYIFHFPVILHHFGSTFIMLQHDRTMNGDLVVRHTPLLFIVVQLHFK